MCKVYVLFDDPYYGAAMIYGVYSTREAAEKRAYDLSTDTNIWGEHTRENWRWNYEIEERELEE